MKRLYLLKKTWYSRIFAVAIFLSLIHPASGQQSPTVEKGLVRIKVTENLAVQLEQAPITKGPDGILLTGISSLDQFNRIYHVKEIRRLFRHAGKFEARHRKYGLHRWYEIRMDDAGSELKAVTSYQSLINIEKAEPVYQKAIVGSGNINFRGVIADERSLLSKPVLLTTPDDPMLGSQWHYNNTGQTGGTVGADIHLFDAWKNETGKPEVVVAINDGGVQTDHPDLSANMWVNSAEIPDNQLDDDNNGFIDDIHGFSFVDDTGTITADDHGTHVAGTIAAVTNNAIGVAGVAGGSGNGDGVRVMSCAVFSDYGADGFPESFIYAADNGAIVSQNSWSYISPGYFEQAVLDAIDYFIAEAGKDENGNQVGLMNGGLVVFSAGNAGSNENYYPAFYEATFSVAATTHQDVKSWYSNYGTWVDISAPGGETDYEQTQGVLSTFAGTQYGYFMGTSMACPHVSGVAALVLSKYGKAGFSPQTLRDRLRYTANPIDATNPSYQGMLGTGRVNAALALDDNDNVAPDAITDLVVSKSVIGEVTLSWTVPSDPGGFVAFYDVRYARSPITDENFAMATQAGKPSSTQSSGDRESFTVTGLEGGTLYYFTVKAIDFQGNTSPVSNIVSRTTELAPVIVVSPSSVTKALQTAEQGSDTFSILNTGPGPLEFLITNASGQNDFASASPYQGNVPPGGSQLITIQFDAGNKLEGTYNKVLVIESNDPEKRTVTVSLTLQVSNNNAPIASLWPDSVNFKSVQLGDSLSRQITLHNAGSDVLIIEAISSDNANFTTDFSESIHISAFESRTLAVTFHPEATGIITSILTLHTNDPDKRTLQVALEGEGLNVPPIVIEPDRIIKTLDRGTTSSGTLVLRNNGSYDRSFRFETIEKGVAENSKIANRPSSKSSTSGRQATSGIDKGEHHKLVPTSIELNALLKPLHSGRSKSVSGNRSNGRTVQTQSDRSYETGFEEFIEGPINEQHSWYAMDGWSIASENPSHGERHLRGTALAPGQQILAISPRIVEDEYYPLNSYTAMRINLDNSRGAAWQVVPQDPWSYVATRIRFTDHGIIDIMSIDENYEIVWTQLDMEFPSGYFDLAITHNIMGDGTSGFPVFEVFINNKKVFHGYSLAGAIGEVALVAQATVAGPVFDVDEYKLTEGEYIPAHVKLSPLSGSIPAGGDVTVSVDVDATGLNFGTYQTDIITHIDESDQIVIPAKVTVTGEASMTTETEAIYRNGYKDQLIFMYLNISNTGGTPVEFELFRNLPGLTLTPSSGTIPIRGQANITATFDGRDFDPAIFYDSIKIVTNVETSPVVYIPVTITIWEELGQFTAPSEVNVQVVQGQIATTTFQVSNTGQNKISFEVNRYGNSAFYSLDPTRGTLSDKPVDITLTLDARFLEEGRGRRYITFNTNDVSNDYVTIPFYYEILPNMKNGSGKILKEEWTGITGNTVASIPVDTPPDSISEITELAGPYGHGDNYGVRIRGYVHAPQTGYYTFYIASDDHSEVWLSSDMDAENKMKIAYLNNFVNPGQFNVYPSQQSEPVYLLGNRKYYIEVLHKEGTGRDHLTVGWRIPDGHSETPIPGYRLFPLNFTEIGNQKPTVNLISPVDGQTFQAPTSIEIKADAFDNDGNIIKVEFYNGTKMLDVDFSAPYTFDWNHVGQGNYQLMAKAFDNYGDTDSAIVNIILQGQEACNGTGTIQQEVWTGISGQHVSSIPFDSPPSLINDLIMFESQSNLADNYGSRTRGYLCIPQTGDYTFWISSDDHSELWLSTDESPANKLKIASITGHTRRRQWDKYASQRSATIHLVAGARYYIEALHKEATGTDHLAVGWQLPDGTMERPIAGNRLIPVNAISVPTVSITSPVSGQQFDENSSITISADANDNDGTVAKVEFYQNDIRLGEDTTVPYSFTWNNVAPGDYTLLAKVFDYGGNPGTSSPVNISVNYACSATGTIRWEFWMNVPGTSVDDIPVNAHPVTYVLDSFESPSYFSNNYGARMSGYICVPQTGAYTFWIASDDNGELWLSTDTDRTNKIRIASVPGHTYSRQWDKYPSQKSAGIHLEAGHQYYIEALHKEATGNDHMAVGWQLPDGTLERPIQGNRLTAHDNEATVARASEDAQNISAITGEHEGSGATGQLKLFPNPASQGNITLLISDENFGSMHQASIEIINATGSTVYSEILSCGSDGGIDIKIDSKFNTGVYIVHATANGRRYSKKLVIH